MPLNAKDKFLYNVIFITFLSQLLFLLSIYAKDSDPEIPLIFFEEQKKMILTNRNIAYGSRIWDIINEHKKLIIEVRERFVDNVYRTKDNRRSDLITRYKTVLDLKAGIGQHRFGAGLDVGYETYHAYDSKDNLRYSVYFNANIFDDENKVKFRFKEKYCDTEQQTYNNIEDESTTDATYHYYTNDVDVQVIYDITPKFTLEALGSYYVKVFKNPGTMKPYCYRRYDMGPIIDFHITPKTTVFAKYSLGFINYYKGLKHDTTLNFGGLGIRSEVTPKSTIDLTTGVSYRYYRNDWIERICSFDFEGKYIYQFSENLELNFTGKREVIDSTSLTNPYLAKTLFDINMVAQKIDPNIRFYLGSGYYIVNYPVRIRNAVNGEVAKLIGQGCSAETKIEYGFNNYVSLLTEYKFTIYDTAKFSDDYAYYENQIILRLRGKF